MEQAKGTPSFLLVFSAIMSQEYPFSLFHDRLILLLPKFVWHLQSNVITSFLLYSQVSTLQCFFLKLFVNIVVVQNLFLIYIFVYFSIIYKFILLIIASEMIFFFYIFSVLFQFFFSYFFDVTNPMSPDNGAPD